MSSANFIIVCSSIFPTIVTIAGNTVFLITLSRTFLLHTPSNVLLGALCVTDLLAGLVCQPMFISVLLSKPGPNYVPLIKTFNCFFSMSCLNSFLCSLLITLDRYAAICYPYRYRELATCKKYVLITLCIFVLVMIRSILEAAFLKSTDELFWSVQVGIQLLVIIVVLILYAKIYRIVLSHRKRMKSIGEISVAPGSTISRRERNRTHTVTIILAVFIACNIPYVVYGVQCVLYRLRKADYSLSLGLWANYLVLLNSCLNPIIYCARSQEIRKAAWRIFMPNSRFGRDTVNETVNSMAFKERSTNCEAVTSEL